MKNSNQVTKKFGFTIIELLVVIVIIGILTAIMIVSYIGITGKAVGSTLQSDLTNAKGDILLYQAEKGIYPTNVNDCPTPSSTSNLCFKYSSGNSYDSYSVDNNSSPKTFTLVYKNGSTYYKITNDAAPIAIVDPNWLTIGTQVWAKANLNVGTRISGATAQTNNATLEKYCFADTESNCTTYGGLYQWDEAMQYVTTNGAQGICPTGSHIPTDNDWKILEMQLGMTQAQADTGYAWRGTDQGTQLKPGGTSGLNMPLAGFRYTDGSFYSLSSNASLWSSSQSSTSAWLRNLSSGLASVFRTTDVKGAGFSVRCLGN